MKITILAEDTAEPKSSMRSEHGFSALAEFGEERILFDTGQSDAFIRNAKKLGVDLSKTDFVAISHGHYDHTGGLPQLMKEFDIGKMTFVSHPKIFEEKLHGSRERIGCPVSRADVESSFRNSVFATGLIEFTPGATFLGQVPRTYEDPGTCGDHIVNGAEQPDSVLDDSAIAFKTGKGVVVLTGCSHSGILNIARAAENLGRVHAIIGGFHLGGASRERLDKIIASFRKMGVKEPRPGHCTGPEATGRMERELGAKRLTAGEVIRI